MAKPVILGTAGHIDHGKSTLIRALTGIDPDRLKEEKERGMTLDLGFAHLFLAQGTGEESHPQMAQEVVLGIVDVPGHERFLKNMLAGATGVDLALLVIDSEEGVMPQTREHTAILQLLGVAHAVVALTKIDRVEPEWLDLVEEQVREFLQGTLWQEVPIVRVSAVTGEGLEQLKQALYRVACQVEGKPSDRPFRLPIDRVFVRPGFGTVVTGTLVAGTVQVGERLQLLPQGLTARVRGLQTYGRAVERAVAGERVAINLVGIEKTQLERGDVLAAPDTYAVTQRFHAHLTLLASPITHGERPESLLVNHQMRVRIHLGTAEAFGRLFLLEDRPLRPGESGFVQIRLETPLVCVEGDRFILRRYSPLTTLGGGVILEAIASKSRRNDPILLQALRERLEGAPEARLEALLKSYPEGISEKEWLARHPEIERTTLQALVSRGVLVVLGEATRWFFHSAHLSALKTRLLDTLGEYHRENPLRSGTPPETLRSLLKWDKNLFDLLLNHLVEEGKLVRFTLCTTREVRLRLPDFSISLNPRQASLLERIERLYREAGLQVPSPIEASRAVGAPPSAILAMLQVGIELERFVQVAENLFYPVETIQEMQAMVSDYLRQHGSLTAARFRDLTHSSRKYAVPLLEYFDSIGFTRRVGDERVLI